MEVVTISAAGVRKRQHTAYFLPSSYHVGSAWARGSWTAWGLAAMIKESRIFLLKSIFTNCMHEEGKKCGDCGQGGCGCGSGGSGCRCPHHKVVGVLVVLFGLLFLLGAYGVVGERTVSVGWPLLVLLGGLMKLTSGKCKCC